MKTVFVFVLSIVMGAATLALAQQDPKPASSSAAGNKKGWQDVSSEGEKRFQQNCGRCHTPPSSISPRIAGTVLRHMRVRANLSKEDEKYILQFLAPTGKP